MQAIRNLFNKQNPLPLHTVTGVAIELLFEDPTIKLVRDGKTILSFSMDLFAPLYHKLGEQDMLYSASLQNMDLSLLPTTFTRQSIEGWLYTQGHYASATRRVTYIIPLMVAAQLVTVYQVGKKRWVKRLV